MTAITIPTTTPLRQVDKPLFALTGGVILTFCLWALVDLKSLSVAVDAGFAWSARYFGLYWQLLLLGTFLVSLMICVLPGAKAKLGKRDKPEFTVSPTPPASSRWWPERSARSASSGCRCRAGCTRCSACPTAS